MWSKVLLNDWQELFTCKKRVRISPVDSTVKFQDNEFGACNLNKPFGIHVFTKIHLAKSFFLTKPFLLMANNNFPKLPEEFFRVAIKQISLLYCFHVISGALSGSLNVVFCMGFWVDSDVFRKQIKTFQFL